MNKEQLREQIEKIVHLSIFTRPSSLEDAACLEKEAIDAIESLIKAREKEAVEEFVDWVDIGADDIEDLKGAGLEAWFNGAMKHYLKQLEKEQP